MKFRVGCIATVISASLVGTLQAQQDRWDRQVDSALQRSNRTLASQGYRASGQAKYGLLFLDESSKLEFPVSGKGDFLVVGACDRDCTGLQLVIANATGYEIDAARGPGNTPVVKVSAPMTPGSYRVKVTLSGCRVSPCRFGVAPFERR